MATETGRVGIGAFACAFGDRERSPESIEGYEAICADRKISLSLSEMGCKTFWQMTRPLEAHMSECIAQTMSIGGASPGSVTHLILATSDDRLRHLNSSFARDVLRQLGLVNCVPMVISLQQCVSSLTALDYACRVLGGGKGDHAIVAAFDFVVDDKERIQPFALFGDAVASCMISRGDDAKLSLASYSAGVDFDGIEGRDTFESRKRTLLATLEAALADSATRLADVEKCFSTNFYKPLYQFNASICGIRPHQLHVDTLPIRAHCGNCDWMINLIDYDQHAGLASGKKYLAQAFAPGFLACGMLESAR